ncbi:MAG: glycosyltransferase family 2 protein [Microcoleaceae cyanobacterium]
MECITEKVTIGIVNYNGLKTISRTLESIKQLDYSDFEVIVVDNLSTDGSRDLIQAHYPEVKCLCLAENRGPAGGRNAILQVVTSDYVLFLDNDIALEPDTLTRLMEVIKAVPSLGICHPEIHDPKDPYCHHYNGGWIHYLGALIARDLSQEERPEYEIFDVVSGAAMLVNVKIARIIGGFDEDYFFNWEDGDFAMRLTLSGHLCANVPLAVVHHLGKPRGTSKAFYMIRNRWFFLLKLYSWRTLMLCLPMLLLFDAAQFLMLLIKGEGREYWRANWDLIQKLPQVMEKRRQFQSLKLKRDRDWLRSGEVYVPSSLVAEESLLSRVKEILTWGFVTPYWRLVKLFC